MARNLNHQDFVKLFAKTPAPSGPVIVPSSTSEVEAKENIEIPENYKRCNQSLIAKNSALKAEIASLQNKLSDLRQENTQQREKIALLESDLDEEKIDFLVAERFRKKIGHLKTLTERTVQQLGRAAEEYRDFFCDLRTNVDNAPPTKVSLPVSLQTRAPSTSRPKAFRASGAPSLEKVTESPLVKSKQRSPVRATTISPASNVTVRRTPKPGRRSTGGNITANCTPRTRRGGTPAPSTSPCNGTDTVRQKRAAASRISSFAEPSLHTKLRRPGKYDEPSPYISTEFI